MMTTPEATEAMVRAARAALEAAAETIETQGDSAATEALGQRLCCNGQDCGCRGSTVEEWLTYLVRAIDPALLVARMKETEE
jgi:hypothetical protein